MIKKYAKAITAAIATGAGTLSTALTDGTVAPGEWLAVIIAVAGALGITAAIPNRTDNP